MSKWGWLIFALLAVAVLLAGCVKEQEAEVGVEGAVEKPPAQETPQEEAQPSGEQQPQRMDQELVEKYNSYRKLIYEKAAELRTQQQPGAGQTGMAGEGPEYRQEYPPEVAEFRSILLEFRQFILDNREALIAAGIDPTEELSIIEEQLAQVQRREAEADKVVISLPFDKESYSKRDAGLWPFCVHGGEHPEGHGGIDFDLREGTLVLAAADGVVEEIFSEEKGYNVFIGHGSVVTGYIPVLDLRVKKGDTVKKGQAIGRAGHDNKGKYFIHFEVNDYAKGGRVCPYDFFDDEEKKLIDAWLKDATYPEKSREPYICNCQGPIPPA